jgi:hypothetical protein
VKASRALSRERQDLPKVWTIASTEVIASATLRVHNKFGIATTSKKGGR